MWTTRLLVLGLVRWLQPVHGYYVHRELMSWGVGDWANVKRGSIYHTLKKLAADGRLEITSTRQVDNRPARTSYQITAEGEEEFQSLLREKLWAEPSHPDEGFWIAWTFIPVLSHRESAALLRNRAALLSGHLQDCRGMLADPTEDPRQESFLPRHVQVSMKLKVQALQLEVDWCHDTAAMVEAGGLYSAEQMTPEQIREWKAQIDTLDAHGRPRGSGG